MVKTFYFDSGKEYLFSTSKVFKRFSPSRGFCAMLLPSASRQRSAMAAAI
jgi:hypothetical protein